MQNPHPALRRIIAFTLSFAVAAALFVSGTAYAAPASDGFVTLPAQIPSPVASGSAQLLGPHAPNADISIVLGLPLRNADALSAVIAQEAATRQFMTQEQFDAQYGATSQQVHAVQDWAQGHALSVSYTSPDGLVTVAHGTTAAVDAAFRVQINDYRDATGRTFFAATGAPQVPTSLGLQTVSGLTSYTEYHTMTAPHANGGQAGYKPAQFRSAYDLSGHGIDGTGQVIGLTIWGMPMKQTDLHGFAAATGDAELTGVTTSVSSSVPCPLSSVNGTVANVVDWCLVNGASSTQNADTEIAMDTEYAHAMAPNSHLKYYLSDCIPADCSGGPDGTGLVKAVTMAANDPTLHVVSNSWGGPEINTDSGDYANNLQMHNEFAHAAAVGTTFYFSSGDKASNSGGTGLPTFPAEDPYVVAVGGTHLEMDSTLSAYVEESAWSTDSSGAGGGGGCSPAFARPSWQLGDNMATCAGRAEPDIAADADSASGAYVYINGGQYEVNGTPTPVGGTSLAAPLVAGMAAVTNRYLSQNGKPLMGFAGPGIYQLANDGHYRSYFHDVQCGGNGYPTEPGWDQATGWGSEDWYQYTLGWASGAPGPSLPSEWGCENSGVSYDLHDVACPAVHICYAVGDTVGLSGPGEIVKTTDSGNDWVQQTNGVPNEDLYGIACPTTSVCYAVGGSPDGSPTVLKTTNGGATWVTQSIPISDGYLEHVMCLSTTSCFTAGYSAYTGNGGGVVLKTTDGSTWTDAVDSITDDSGDWATLYGISCISASGATTCYAVGYGFNAGTYTDVPVIVKTSDAGSTWSAVSTPSSVGSEGLNAVTCNSSTSCYVVGTDDTILYTTTGGSSWTLQAHVSSGPTLSGITCITATSCTAVGSVIQSTVDGSTWTNQNMPLYVTNVDGYMLGVACPDNSICYTVGNIGFVLLRDDPAPVSMAIQSGWNLIGVPRQLGNTASMSTLVTSLNGSTSGSPVKALASYANGSFQVFVPGYSADQSLQPQQGIFALSTAAHTWTMTGMDFVAGAAMLLQPGWNLVTVPYPPTGMDGTTLDSQLDGTCGMKEAAMYTGSGYKSYIAKSNSTFHVSPGAGLWIQCTSQFWWQPS